jgi:hypothetical protein
MSPLISRATDNLGLIFSLQLGGAGGGPVPVQEFDYDIELFGEGFESGLVNDDPRWGPGDGGTTPSQRFIRNNGGGYTKLRMQSLTSSEISFEPQLYLGGNIKTTGTFFNSFSYADGTSFSDTGSFVVDRKAAGNAAAFSIDGEWMGIAGGGSQSYYVQDTDDVGTPTGALFGSVVLNLVECSGLPQDGGQGGINFSDPSAIPQNGPDLTSGLTREFSFNSQNFGSSFADFTRRSDVNVGGAGGAGAGPGESRDSTTLTPSTGGAGNIRIWADTAGVDGIAAGQFSGDISSVPGTIMELIDDRDGIEIGESRVAITATNTGLGITYTTNNTLSLRELKALLDPELEFAFDIELYGEGIGQDNTITSVTNQVGGVPPATVVPNNSGRGGYTKLRMIVPSSASQISFEPNKYAGGISTTTRTEFVIGVPPVVNSFEFGKGGDAAAFSIDGEWMGIAGGSGQVYYKVDTNISIPTSSITETSTIISSPSVFGRGGVNAATPTASPEGGQGKLNEGVANLSGINQTAFDYRGGSGGGGAGPGLAYAGPDDGPATTVPSGGAGNIRVYEQTSGASDNGNISLPGLDAIYMRLENSRDNFWLGASKVVVSHPITGVSLEYNTDTTLTRRELQALLIPTRDIIFDIELFGQGYNDRTIQSLQFISAGVNTGSTVVTATYNVVGGRGGYTKLRMTVPVSSTSNISLLPRFYRGGINTNNATAGNVGGNAAAFSIDGEWMAAAGGGVTGYWFFTDNYRLVDDGTGTGRQIRSGTQTVSVPVNPGDAIGKGGINTGNPTASPQNGGDFAGIPNTLSFNDTFDSFTGSAPSGGGGGGGAGGGNGIVPPEGPTPGEGNIRVYAERGTTEGELPTAVASAENILMKLTDSQDGFWLGNSKVVITNILTGATTTFTNDTTLTTVELRNILYPGVFPTA